MRYRSLVITVYTLGHVAASYVGRFCPLACELTLNYVTFNDSDTWLSRKVQACRSGLRTESLYLCFDQFCKYEEDIEQWIQGQSTWCEEHAGITLPGFHDVIDTWSPSGKAAVKRLSLEEATNTSVISEIVIPYETFFERAFTTMDVAFWEYDIHRVYGWYMYYFWVAVVIIGISARLLPLIYHTNPPSSDYRPLMTENDQTLRSERSMLDRLRVWVRQYLTIPATFNQRCSQPYGWCTIPPRLQSLTIFFFVAFNVILCTCSYRLTDGNLYWPQKSTQLLRYVSDRTGIISLANFPLVWLFGMRNDFLMWTTGWGFGTFNAFHRWVARIATVEAVIHSLGYTLMIVQSDGWGHFVRYWTKHYFWNGELATIAMCALVAFSFYGIRRAQYEVFLVTHIVLSIAALWAMYYHVEIFTDGEWNIFIWPCLAIWLLDRLLRLVRILAFNRNPLNTVATVSYDPDSNLVRMEVDDSKSWITPQPGTYYYIHSLQDILYAHQSHPFTLAFVSTRTTNTSPTPLSSLTSRPLPSRATSFTSTQSNESDALLTFASTNKKPSNLVFLIRPYDGFTSRVKASCLSHPKKIRVLIDGPYGHTIRLYKFSNVLFVVGGTGVAVPLSHLTRLLAATSHVRRVKIVWAVREHAFVASVLRDFKGLLSDERVDIEVHITREDEAKDDVLGEDLKCVRIMTHRPDVREAIQDAARSAGQQSLAVVACGPALMADQARETSVKMLGRGYGGVEYFEESFKW
ncbi:hypothetical protein ACN47E_007564 [Coniothyrium glycines]